MSMVRKVSLSAAAGAVLLFIYLFFCDSKVIANSAPADPVRGLHSETKPGEREGTAMNANPASRAGFGATVPAENIRRSFSIAADYSKFARAIRDAAYSGSPEAEYFYGYVSQYCGTFINKYFTIQGKEASLSEVRQHWVGLHQLMPTIELAYGRCQGFLGSGKGDLAGDDMMEKSAKQHYPLAEVLVAQKLEVGSMLESMGASNPGTSSITDSPHALVMDAIKSRDPEVIFNLAALVPSSTDGAAPDKANALRLLACSRGYDCSAQASWVHDFCVYDSSCYPGITGEILLTKIAGEKIDDVKNGATEVGQMIDSGRWDELDQYLWPKH